MERMSTKGKTNYIGDTRICLGATFLKRPNAQKSFEMPWGSCVWQESHTQPRGQKGWDAVLYKDLGTAQY